MVEDPFQYLYALKDQSFIYFEPVRMNEVRSIWAQNRVLKKIECLREIKSPQNFRMGMLLCIDLTLTQQQPIK